jgi:hypothetical protein
MAHPFNFAYAFYELKKLFQPNKSFHPPNIVLNSSSLKITLLASAINKAIKQKQEDMILLKCRMAISTGCHASHLPDSSV